MEDKARVVIAEDHAILRDGLRALLTSCCHLDVVGEAANGLEAIRLVGETEPDLLLLDLSMPRMNGLTAIREVKRNHPGTRILCLTVHTGEEYVSEVFSSGAEGYCLKDATREELSIAVRSVLAGKRYLGPGVSEHVVTGYLNGVRQLGKERNGSRELTQREKEVLKLIGEGYKNREVGDILCISIKTVEKHRANIMRKLDLHNAAELTGYAIEKGLVSP
ncbi:MAG: response regulator [Desulfatibacillaceae bacterium]